MERSNSNSSCSKTQTVPSSSSSSGGDHQQQQSKPSIHNVPQQQLNSSRRLIGACKKKDLETVAAILSEQPELINQRDRYNRNLLHYTVILFKQSPNNNQSETSDTTTADCDPDCVSLLDATEGPDEQQRTKDNLACFNYLLDRCNQKLWWQQDLDGLSLLHLAVISSNNPLVKFVVYEHPYSIKYPLVSTPDNERHSPLHWAVITNNLECVKLLINCSAGVKLIHEPDFNGATPLHYATQTNDYPKYRKQLRLMLRNVACDQMADEAQQKTNSEPPVRRQESAQDRRFSAQSARRKSGGHHNLEVLETLVKTPQVNIECRDKDRRTPLLWAASSGNRDAVLLLIGAGADPQSCDVNRLGALHCAASHGFTECLESLLSVSKRGSSTSSALASERSVNQPDNLNCTPIFYAVLSGNIDCVELLADRGAQLDWQDSKGRSAAHFAALKGQLNSLKLLRRRGANLWLANKQGDLPLHYALKAGRHQVAKWLLDHSPYENSVNAINNFGRAPVHLVVQRDDADLLDYLIKRGANLNQLVKVKDNQQRGNSRRIKLPSGSSTSETAMKQREQFAGSKGSGSVSESRSKPGSGGEYHYETALDMAKKLGHDASLRLLVENGAQTATQVMNGRMSALANDGDNNRPAVEGANVNSLFDLQSVDGPSPIRYDTSSSSAASPHQIREDGASTGETMRNEESALPKLSRPRPDSLPQSDSSGGSSALSQNSLTSIRGYHASRPPGVARAVGATDHRRQHHGLREEDSSPVGSKPFRGGISYNNERINASIKCKLYDNHYSYPPPADCSNVEQEQQGQPTSRGPARLRSAPTSGQEIITNVNVYTSPCPLAGHHYLEQQHLSKSTSRYRSKHDEDDDSATSDGPETSCDEANTESKQPRQPQQQQQQQHWNVCPTSGPLVVATPGPATQQHRTGSFNLGQHSSSRLPPSQSHEQHLPVILSEREDITTSGGETSNDRSPEVADDFEPLYTSGAAGASHSFSPSHEEPRFDRTDRGRGRPTHTRRDHVKSPVGEYIRAPMPSTLHDASAKLPGGHLNQHYYGSHHLPDFSQIKPKVDSHRPSEDPSRSRSLTRHHPPGKQPSSQPSRSLSRQTFTREPRHESQDSFEFELGVERSIRKYKQEKRLFEELQGLKRSQIRSGRANEAVLVKRLVEHLRREQLAGSNDLLGMDNYTGPYTYKSYERFLYDQLRKLSQSNCAKLDKSMRDFEHELRSNMDDLLPHEADGGGERDTEFEAEQDRNFLEEDMQADMELRRVIDGEAEEPMKKTETLVVATDESTEPKHAGQVPEIGLSEHIETAEADDRGKDSEPEVRRGSIASAGSSSRRSSIDVEREKLKSLPLRTSDDRDAADQQLESEEQEAAVDDETRSLIECEANSICSAIMVDALGNITPHSPVPETHDTDDDDDELEERRDTYVTEKEPASGATGDSSEGETFAQAKSRRRSVVNIGNKLEVIYHDVGIEIDHAADSSAAEESAAEEEGGEKGEQEEGAATETEKSTEERASEAAAVEKEMDEEGVGELHDELQQEKPAEVSSRDSRKMDQPEEQQRVEIQPADQRAQTGLRRASSPPGTIDRRRGPMDSRRLGSVDSGASINGATSHIAEIKKVFNGHDLDDLHRRRESQSKSENRRQVDKQAARHVARGKATSKRPKRERSHPPKEKFEPQVDVDQIRQRWSRVKAIERARRSRQADAESGEQISYLAKSQPNLERMETTRGTTEFELDSDARQNYKLLYEINTRSRDERASKRGIWWCQQKAVKIVDVRSLKRTLSLPESVLYSNDLMKKFNILKL